MRKAGFLGIIYIDLDFGGTDLANGTKNSDDVHRETECSTEDDPPALGGYRGEKNAQSGSSVDPQSGRGVAAGGVTASKSMGTLNPPRSHLHVPWRP